MLIDRRFLEKVRSFCLLFVATATAWFPNEFCSRCWSKEPGIRVAAPIVEKDKQEPDVEIELVASADEVSILKGKPTPVWRFQGSVLKGRESVLSNGKGYLGPTIRLIRKERVRIHFVNHLEEPSIIHWHGLIVPERADGHPLTVIGPNERYTYDFTVNNRAGTYLYHPHPHMRTAFQVYKGLAGVVIVSDPEEDKIGLPSGDQDQCIVLQDRRFDAANRLMYPQTMMEQLSGAVGNKVVVNGLADASLSVERRPYRLRFVNASNSRIYKLAWSDGLPMQVIGTDGGLLSGDEGPKKYPFVVLGPFERIEIWEDFSKRKPGTKLALVSEKFTVSMRMGGMRSMGPGMGGMMNMNMGGERLQIARVEIGKGDSLPGELPKLPGKKPELIATRRDVQTTLAFRMMRGLLNGRTYKENDLTDQEKLTLNQPVTWTFDNGSEMGMQMPHPMHIHGVQFRVIARKNTEANDLAKGLVNEGWKDTILVFPGETVKVHLVPTEPGSFLYHCHNLEHEDMGMMRNFQVSDK